MKTRQIFFSGRKPVNSAWHVRYQIIILIYICVFIYYLIRGFSFDIQVTILFLSFSLELLFFCKGLFVSFYVFYVFTTFTLVSWNYRIIEGSYSNCWISLSTNSMLCFCFFFFNFRLFRAALAACKHVEVPRLGVKSEL